MSVLIYPRGVDLSVLSLKLLWRADWPYCMECGGPLMRSTHDRAEVRAKGTCIIEGNAHPVDVRYVALDVHFHCNFCAEYHNISWYFFYNRLDDGRHQLDSNFYAVMKAPRLKREHVNRETYDLLRGMRLR